MSRDPLATISTVRTPQSQPIPGRTDMIRNGAGGYGFAKDLWLRLEQFLILGSTGGTYYVGEKSVTLENVQIVLDAVAADGPRAVGLARSVTDGRPPRAPRNHPALFLLAVAIASDDLPTRRAARTALPFVARTTFHQAVFFGYWKALHGKPSKGGTSPRIGRLTRGAFGDLLLAGSANSFAFQACKATSRKTTSGEAFSLRDMLRIAHPKAESPQRRAAFGWLAGNVDDAQARELLPAVDAYLTAKASTTPAAAVKAISERGVPWEFLPDEVLKSPEVWEALIETIGATALLRNLARMTQLGTLKPMSAATRRVGQKLADREYLAAGRIHPLDVYLALRVYVSGRAQPDPRAPVRTWSPVPAVADALEEAFDLSFGYIVPSGRHYLVAVDSSGSMSYASVMAGGSNLGTVYQTACTMAAIIARLERGNAHVIDVDTSVYESRITGRTNLREIATWAPSGGGTDLSLPFSYAAAARLEVDGFLLLTDNETWAGNAHASQTLTAYRSSVNPDARCVVASMTPNASTIADPRDPGVLNVAGFDASLPQLALGFIG